MTYMSTIAGICASHQHEIEVDLATALKARDEARSTFDHADRRVAFLVTLSELRSDPQPEVVAARPIPGLPSGAQGTMTLHAAMHKVIRESPDGKLRAGEIIAEIDRQRLYRMRDGRLPESQQIHARANHYPQMFGKDGSYFYAK